MFKYFSIVVLLTLLLSLNSHAQYYKIKWTAPQGSVSYSQILNTYYSIPNYKQFDVDNDKVEEIIVSLNFVDTSHSGAIYDGATYTLKYYIRTSYTLNGNTYRPAMSAHYIYGFYDLDGDNTRELVCAGYSSTDSNFSQGYLIIDVANDRLEYVVRESINLNFPPGFADIDNDGSIEMITPHYIIGRSSTPVTQPAALLKRADPIVKIFPNPVSTCAKIEYYVPTMSFVKIGIFDVSGKLITTLVNAQKKPGDFVEIWDGKSDDRKIMAAGHYYYTIQIGDFVTTRKVVLLQ